VEPPLGRRLYLGHRAVHDVLDQRLQALGASLWNWVLLREATRASGASQRELADLMHIEPPTLVRHLDRLEADGYVERRPDPDDRRAWRLYLTPRGSDLLDQLRPFALETFETALEGIEPADREQLMTMLERIRTNLSRKSPVKVEAHG
jgi:DNA-binding MarR family transcriptional regulator